MSDHFKINYLRDAKDGKTKIFECSSKGTSLGEIKWFDKWSKYCFYPVEFSLFDEECLCAVSSFIESLMINRRNNEDIGSLRV